MSKDIYRGYIYLWYDTKAKLFYLGGHKGKIEDSYICSSKNMLRAYRKRPDTFRFKVLEYIFSEKVEDLRLAEQKWLNMIKEEELYWTSNIYSNTVRYYNQKKISLGGSAKGHKKKRIKPAWNKGYTKEQISLRKKGLFCFLQDKPKNKICNNKKIKLEKNGKFCKVYFLVCEKCGKFFSSRKTRKRFCSLSCRSSNNAKFVKFNGMKKDEVRKKFAKQVTGRKLKTDENGNRYWTYPNKNESVIL